MARRSFPGSLDRPGTAWRWRVSVGGERHTFSFDGSLSYAAAGDAARDKYKQLQRRAKRKAAGLPIPGTVAELLKRYEDEEIKQLATGSQACYVNEIKAARLYFDGELDDPELDMITAGDVHGFLN